MITSRHYAVLAALGCALSLSASGGDRRTVNLTSFPLAFEINRGQMDPRADFLARGNDFAVLLNSQGVYVKARSTAGDNAAFQMRLVSSTPSPAALESTDSLPSIVNYFIGKDPGGWRTNIPTYRRVRYNNIYPGIDIVYYGNRRQLEYDFLVSPGSKVGLIQFVIGGARGAFIDEAGDLLVSTTGSEVRYKRPMAYQLLAGKRKQVPVKYQILANHVVTFSLGRYDRTRPLVIDPVLVYSGVIGGSSQDQAQGIAIDAAGNAYITGNTLSADFPTVGAFQNAQQLNSEVFVAKVNPSGSSLIYSTFIGGSGIDQGSSIAVDALGNAYVTGSTTSQNFPVANAIQPNLGGQGDAFVVALNSSGNSLIYSTYLGGLSTDQGNGIAVNKATGEAYVTGQTTSSNFPTLAAIQPTIKGYPNAFITKFDSSGNRLFSTFFGGSSGDSAQAIALDYSANVYITGTTSSSNFPTTSGAYRQTPYAGSDIFVSKLSSDGSTVLYSTYLGGSGSDFGRAIAVHSDGTAYLTGYTNSPDLPVTASAVQPVLAGDLDAFVARLSAAGDSLVFLTYLGGGKLDQGNGIAVDFSSASAYVVGFTNSPTFPATNALQTSKGGIGAAVYSTSNGGAQWTIADGGLPISSASGVSINPITPSAIVIATDRGIERTTNGGESWNVTAVMTNTTSLSRSAGNPTVLYASAAGAITRSTDDGVTWTYPVSILANYVQLVATHPTNWLVALAAGNGIIKTIDGGISWQNSGAGILNNSYISDLTFDPNNGQTIYAVSNGSVYKSVTGGTTWTPVNNGLTLGATTKIAIAPSASNVVYAVSQGSIYKSSDGGGTWTLLPTSPALVATLAVSPSDLNTIYAGVSNRGVYRSSDGGATWARMNAGIERATLTAIAVHPTNPLAAFAGTTATQSDAFVVKLNSIGTSLTYSTYLGGAAADQATGVATDSAGKAYVTGYTNSTDFPLTLGAVGQSNPLPNLSAGHVFLASISDSTPSCANTITPSSRFIYSSYPSTTVDYDVIAPSGCGWTASSSAPWATVVSSATGSGLGTITISAPYNNTSSTRTALISVSGQVVTLNQSACSGGTLSTNSIAAPVTGGAFPVTLNIGVCDWNSTNVPNWIGLSSPSGAGSMALIVTVAPNPAPNPRYAQVYIGNSYLSISQTGTCIYMTNPASVVVPATGASNTIAITATGGTSCSWSSSVAVGSPWLSITSGYNGIGNGFIGYSVAASSGTARTGTIKIGGVNFLVSQGFFARDFRGIGRSDVFLYDRVTGNSYAGLSNGNGLFTYVYNPYTPGFDILRTGDWNGTGKAGLVVYNKTTALAYLGVSNGTGNMSFSSLFWSPGFDLVEAGDLNADGRTDFILHRSSDGTTYTALSNGTGGFTYTYALVSVGFTQMRVADFNGDGNADVLFYRASDGLSYLGLSNGNGTFNFSPVTVAPGYDSLQVGDFNADGKQDVLFYNSATGAASIGLNTGAGFVFSAKAFSPGFTAVRVGDVNRDGLADTILYNKNTAVGYLGIGDGTGSFSFASLFWSPGFDYVELQDLNRDGALDLVMYNSLTGTAYSGLNNGSGVFSYLYSYWGIGKVLAK